MNKRQKEKHIHRNQIMIVQREGKKRSTGIANIYRACRMSHRVRLYVGVEIERQTERERETKRARHRETCKVTLQSVVYTHRCLFETPQQMMMLQFKDILRIIIIQFNARFLGSPTCLRSLLLADKCRSRRSLCNAYTRQSSFL